MPAILALQLLLSSTMWNVLTALGASLYFAPLFPDRAELGPFIA